VNLARALDELAWGPDDARVTGLRQTPGQGQGKHLEPSGVLQLVSEGDTLHTHTATAVISVVPEKVDA
jgi:hypothetical protein